MSFKASAWVEDPAHVVRSKILNGAKGCAHASGPRIQPEMDKPSLDGEKRANPAVPGDDLGAKESMQNFEVAVHNRHCWSGVEIFREGLLEVVAHLAFKHDVGERLDPRACS